jgi:hypothetical protein
VPARTVASLTRASPAVTRPAAEAHPPAPRTTAGDRAAAPRAARRAVAAAPAAAEASEPNATPPADQDAGQPAAAAAPAVAALAPGGTPLTYQDAGQRAAGGRAVGPAPGFPTGMQGQVATGGAPVVARRGASGRRPAGGSASCRGRPARAGVARARAARGALRAGVLGRQGGRDRRTEGRLGGIRRLRGLRGRLGGPGSGLRVTRSGPSGSGPPFGRRTGPPRPTGRRSARC